MSTHLTMVTRWPPSSATKIKRSTAGVLDGRDLELDLSAENATEMRETLRKYVDAARKTGSSKTGRASARRTVTDVDPKAVRAWAAANGREVSSRGRIPAEVVEAYRAAGN
jgi:Lsr2